MNVLLIGYGAISREIIKHIGADEPARISAVLVRPARLAETRAALPDDIQVVTDLDDLLMVPDLAAECAGHQAVAQYGVEILRRGIDLVVISIGCLSDPALYAELSQAAVDGQAKLLLPAGAVAGADALAAARVGGLSRVTYTSRKPPGAWKGTPAELEHDLASMTEETILLDGKADEAARLYPQNANVAATIALAGAGFDKTDVRLIADPAANGNIHQLHAEGAFGEFDVEIRGKPLPDNPKTSTLAAHSVIHAIRNKAGAIEI